MSKKYSHAYDLGFEVVTTNPDGASNEEIIAALKQRVYDLENGGDPSAACGLFDTHEEVEEDTPLSIDCEVNEDLKRAVEHLGSFADNDLHFTSPAGHGELKTILTKIKESI